MYLRVSSLLNIKEERREKEKEKTYRVFFSLRYSLLESLALI